MKNLRKKICISLTALAILGFTTGSANAGVVTKKDKEDIVDSYQKSKEDPVTQLVNTLQKTRENFVHSYKISDGKEINFLLDEKDGRKYLEVQIYGIREDSDKKKNVFIRDYGLNHLDNTDEIVYHESNYDSFLGQYIIDEKSFEFGELSAETQGIIRNEYGRIIKEAPERLMREHEEVLRRRAERKEMERKNFEKNVLDVLVHGEKISDSAVEHDSYKFDDKKIQTGFAPRQQKITMPYGVRFR